MAGDRQGDRSRPVRRGFRERLRARQRAFACPPEVPARNVARRRGRGRRRRRRRRRRHRARARTRVDERYVLVDPLPLVYMTLRTSVALTRIEPVEQPRIDPIDVPERRSDIEACPRLSRRPERVAIPLAPRYPRVTRSPPEMFNTTLLAAPPQLPRQVPVVRLDLRVTTGRSLSMTSIAVSSKLLNIAVLPSLASRNAAKAPPPRRRAEGGSSPTCKRAKARAPHPAAAPGGGPGARRARARRHDGNAEPAPCADDARTTPPRCQHEDVVRGRGRLRRSRSMGYGHASWHRRGSPALPRRQRPERLTTHIFARSRAFLRSRKCLRCQASPMALYQNPVKSWLVSTESSVFLAPGGWASSSRRTTSSSTPRSL